VAYELYSSGMIDGLGSGRGRGRAGIGVLRGLSEECIRLIPVMYKNAYDFWQLVLHDFLAARIRLLISSIFSHQSQTWPSSAPQTKGDCLMKQASQNDLTKYFSTKVIHVTLPYFNAPFHSQALANFQPTASN
jgi:hypothetical protein